MPGLSGSFRDSLLHHAPISSSSQLQHRGCGRDGRSTGQMMNDSKPMVRLCGIFCALFLCTGTVVLGQSSTGSGAGSSSKQEGSADGIYGVFDPPVNALGIATTNLMVARITELARLCETASPGHRIDCLGKGYLRVARGMPKGSAYRPIRTELFRTGKALREIARQNSDDRRSSDSGATGAIRGGEAANGPSSFRLVKEANLAAANSAAIAVIQEAQTRILRSAENSHRRRVHYRRIAVAMDSSTRILRSRPNPALAFGSRPRTKPD